MEPKVQRWVQREGWNRAAPCYERYWRRQLQPSVDRLLALADFAPGERVIDVACGTGAVTLAAAEAVGPTGAVLATDVSPAMVAEVARRADCGGLSNVEVACVGAEDLDADAAFDVGSCSLGLMYVPDPLEAARRLARSVRPGGRVVASVWGERRNCGWAELFPIVDRRVSSDVCPMFFALGAPGALVSLLTSAGLNDAVESRLSVELVYTNADEALGAAFLGGPVALAASRFDDADRAAADAEYLDSIACFAHDGGYRVPGEFVVVAARRGLEPQPRATSRQATSRQATTRQATTRQATTRQGTSP